ncbi:MAG: thiamine-phosphate kinase [Myxococcota bacterium]|nr:thiamine-phosphate kinase [Myxococcota bacterium]
MPDDPGEQFVLRSLLSAAGPRPDAALRVPPGDDCAVLDGGLVLTQDSFVQGVHWDERFSPADVGFRLAMANLSDLAAMGATGLWAMLGCSLPAPVDRDWVRGFSRGLAQGLGGVPLVGGDTTRSPGPAMLSLCLGGQLVAEPVTRSGSSPADEIWVSGVLGAAAGGYAGIPELLPHFLRPSPPLELGPALARERLVSAAMDLSDGLAQDLPKLCAASGVGARISADALPLPTALASRPSPLDDALGFGEDFGLLFTAAPEHHAAISALGARLGVKLTCIGHTTADPSVTLIGADWPTGWTHFGEPA